MNASPTVYAAPVAQGAKVWPLPSVEVSQVQASDFATLASNLGSSAHAHLPYRVTIKDSAVVAVCEVFQP